MATIIGIKISQKKEDIEIMKLIGATNWYIRWPFLTEGVVYGIIGAVVGWADGNGRAFIRDAIFGVILKGYSRFAGIIFRSY